MVDQSTFDECVLVIAGGYDPLNAENEVYYNELAVTVQKLNLESNVIFLKSPSELHTINSYAGQCFSA